MNDEFLAVLAKDVTRDPRLPMGKLRLTFDRVFKALAVPAMTVAIAGLLTLGVMCR